MADRRRLSVSACEPVLTKSSASVENVEDMKDTIQAELMAYIKGQKLPEGSQIALTTTKTDSQGKRRKSFEEKELDGGKDHVFKVVGESLVSTSVDVDSFAKERGIAFMCRKGLKPESPNQDSLSLLMVEGKFHLYGVYDGHGPDGHTVSNIATKLVVAKFLEEVNAGNTPDGAFTVAFEECQAFFDTVQDQKIGKKVCEPAFSGSTCTMALHNLEANTLTIANAGDSRAVLGTWEDQPKFLVDTVDHKPDLDREKAYITSKGGKVVFDGYFNHRVFAKDAHYPGLNMSRALGDVVGHREAGIRATPDTMQIDLETGVVITRFPGEMERRDTIQGFEAGAPLILLLCTDGVWEFIDNKRALSILRDETSVKGELRLGLQELVKESWDQWMKDSDQEISDDITAIGIQL